LVQNILLLYNPFFIPENGITTNKDVVLSRYFTHSTLRK